MNINIRTFFLVLTLILCILTTGIILYVIELHTLNEKLQKSEYDRYLMIQKADELRQSSDDLSRLANKYVISSDDRYKNEYFQVLDIRKGIKPRPLHYDEVYWDLLEPLRSQRHPLQEKSALIAEMQTLPYSPYELEKLSLVELNSNDLSSLEIEAFKAMQNNNQAFAIKLLNSRDYDKAKEKVMFPIDEFLVSIKERTESLIRNYNQEMELLYNRIFTAIVFTLSVFFLAVVIVFKKILLPIGSLTRTILAFQRGEKNIKEVLFYKDEIGLMTEQFFAMKRKLDEDIRFIKELALTDPLTKIGNRRMFFELGEELFKIVRRDKEDISIMILDIDHFKKINDTYGHLVGDEVLKFLVKGLQGKLRESDIVARYGGEEFIALLPKTNLEGAAIVAEKIRSHVENTSYEMHDKKKINITISIGVSEYSPEDKELQNMIHRADEVLYKAKEAGRNRVELFKN